MLALNSEGILSDTACVCDGRLAERITSSESVCLDSRRVWVCGFCAGWLHANFMAEEDFGGVIVCSCLLWEISFMLRIREKSIE